MMVSMVIDEPAVSTACTARDSCISLMAQPVSMPTTIHVAVADCAPTRNASSMDVTLDSIVPSPIITTKPASSAALESDLIKLLELPLSETKEQNVMPMSESKEPYFSPLLPQYTEARVAWGTSPNQWYVF
jgi:hypothetical protein